MTIINRQLLNQLSVLASENLRLRMNHNLHESLDSPVQRLLNALEPGTELPIHRHTHTDETYILLRGNIKVIFYNDSGEKAETFELNPNSGNYGVHIPKGQWHTLEVLEAGSVIFEVKEGPYAPIKPEDVLLTK